MLPLSIFTTTTAAASIAMGVVVHFIMTTHAHIHIFFSTTIRISRINIQHSFFVTTISWFVSIFIFTAYMVTEIPWNWPFNYIEGYISKHPSDLVTPFPWLALPLLGIWAAHFRIFGLDPANQKAIFPYVTSLSQHSLLIYLLHQPLLFAGFSATAWIN